jgi:hypothetical protein
MQAQITEAELTKSITNWLKTLPGCWFYKVAARAPGKTGAQKTGIPDLCVVYKGATVWFEIKRPGPGGKLKPSQEREIPLMREAGAEVRVVRSLEEVKTALVVIEEVGN